MFPRIDTCGAGHEPLVELHSGLFTRCRALYKPFRPSAGILNLDNAPCCHRKCAQPTGSPYPNTYSSWGGGVAFMKVPFALQSHSLLPCAPPFPTHPRTHSPLPPSCETAHPARPATMARGSASSLLLPLPSFPEGKAVWLVPTHSTHTVPHAPPPDPCAHHNPAAR